MSLRLTDEATVPVMLAAGVKPLVAYPGKGKIWPCRCLTCDLEVSPRYNAIQQGQGACKYCAGKAVSSGSAIQAMLLANAQPLEPYPGSGTPWKCCCLKCGSIITPTYNKIQQGRKACKYCSKRAVHPGSAIQAMLNAQAKPLESYPGDKIPWQCLCLTCGSAITPSHHNVKSGQGACKYCIWGKPEDPALVYLTYHSGHRAIKIGISKSNGNRLFRHTKRGWNTLNTWQDDVTVDIAFAVEAKVLDAWRTAGIPAAVSRGAMPQGGYTETAPMDLVDLAQTRRLITRTINAMALKERE